MSGEYLFGEEGPVIDAVLVEFPTVEVELIVKRIVVDHIAETIFDD